MIRTLASDDADVPLRCHAEYSSHDTTGKSEEGGDTQREMFWGPVVIWVVVGPLSPTEDEVFFHEDGAEDGEPVL